MLEPPTRERLIDAARGLLWARGYDATSPKLIMDESGAGQGSLYHHFEGKRALAAAALDAVAADLIVDLNAAFDPKKPGLTRVRDWLSRPRKALSGCKLGRLSMENSVIDDDDLRAPIARYFKAAERALRVALRDAQNEKTLARDVDSDDLAATLLAVVQGGYVLARALRDADKLTEATRGAERLLRAAKR